jgi:hypothetical protein
MNDPGYAAGLVGSDPTTPPPTQQPTTPAPAAGGYQAGLVGAAPSTPPPQTGAPPPPTQTEQPVTPLPSHLGTLDKLHNMGTVNGERVGVIDDADIGFLRHAAQTYSGLADFVAKHFQHGDPTSLNLAAHELAAQPDENYVQKAGGLGEDVAEQVLLSRLMGLGLKGEEAFKAAGKLAKVVADHPVVGQLIRAGVQSGAPAAAQTFARTGGDLPAAAIAGTAGTLLPVGTENALTEEIAPAATKAIRNIQGGGAAKIAQAATDEAAQQGMKKASQDVVGNHITEMNALREAGGQPWWTQQDPDKYTGKVASFPEAVDQVNGVAQDIYKTLNDESGGRFSLLREQQQSAHADLADSDSKENIANAAKADRAMARFWDQAEGAADPVDHEVAKRSYYKALKLNDVSKITENAVTDEGSVNGVQLQQGLNRLRQRWGIGTQGRAVMDDVLGPGVQENLEGIAQANLTRAGQNRMKDSVQTVILKILAKAAAGETAIHALFGAPIAMTTLGGASLYIAGKKFLQLMETNPKIGNAMVWAVEQRIPPETYVPIVSRMVTDYANSRQQPEDTNQTEPSTVSQPPQQ